MIKVCLRLVLTTVICLLTVSLCNAKSPDKERKTPQQIKQWQTMQVTGKPVQRHECGFIGCCGKFHLLGGRRVNPVNSFEPKAKSWSTGSKPPLEIHHFQPVVIQDKIWIAGAMTGPYPKETPLDHILIYDPQKDSWSQGPEIPDGRRRGGGGVVVHKDKLYMVCGIVDGHRGGFKEWLDVYDLKTKSWARLPDAPRPRDHFQAVIIDNKIYAAGGRRTSQRTGQVFQLTVPEIDVFDLHSGTWTSLPPHLNLPTQRAGTSTIAHGELLIVLGGESGQKRAHAEVEAFNTCTQTWMTWPGLVRGRHGTGALIYEGGIYTCSGSGNRGGGPELTSMEVFKQD